MTLDEQRRLVEQAHALWFHFWHQIERGEALDGRVFKLERLARKREGRRFRAYQEALKHG